MLIALCYLLLLLFLLGGLCIVIVSLPGLWVMALAAAVYAVLTKLALITPKVLLVLLSLALVAEIIDFVAAGAGAKRAGASRRGLIGAIIGGMLGAFVFSLPLPIIGTLAGVCIGTFVGALIGELSIGKEIGQSVRIGANATAGKLVGVLFKLSFGALMLLITMWYAWPFSSHRAAPPVSPALASPSAITTTRGG
jgi:uncharacterized protein YqgC (DUF456 family)